MQHFSVTGCDVELAIQEVPTDPLSDVCWWAPHTPPVLHIVIRPRCQDLRNQRFEICGRLLPIDPAEKKPIPAGGALALEDVLRMLKNGYFRAEVVAPPEPIIVGPEDQPVATHVKNHWGLFAGETPMGCPPPAKEGEE